MSPGLEAVIVKALDKDRELRYQTAKELLVDFERLQAATSGAASQPVAVPKQRPRRWPWLVAATVLVTIAAWRLWPLPPPRIIEMHPITRGLDTGLATSLGTPFWATDGVRLYYLDGGASGEAELFQAPINGGEPAKIPLPFRFYRRIVAYLPRESALLMSGFEAQTPTEANAPMWIVSVPSGTATRTSLRAHCAAVSADGERLAWMSGQRIVVGRPDGSQERELLTLESDPHFPSWSPDGQRIRFQANGPGGSAPWIWEVSAAGGTPRALWPGEMGRWTGDGPTISSSTATTWHSRGATCGRCGRAACRSHDRRPCASRRVRSASMPSTRAWMAVVSSRAD